MPPANCPVVPKEKLCPSEIPQLTAEAITRDQITLFKDTADADVLNKFRELARSVKKRWREKEEGNPAISVIAYILGIWGSGKTYYSSILEDVLKSEGIAVKYVVFDNIINNVARARKWENIAQLRNAMVEYLVKDLPADKPAVIILDEFESLVTIHWTGSQGDKMLIDAFIELYQSLVNPDLDFNEDLRGRINLVLLLTPAAEIKLGQILEEPLKKGKIKSRYDFIINLRPLTKDEALALMKNYTRELLGLGLDSILPSEEYINSIYYVTGGVPRIVLSLLRELGRAAEEKCDKKSVNKINVHNKKAECCLCPLNPKDILEALASTSLITSEGENYKPVTSFLVSIGRKLDDKSLKDILTLNPITDKGKAELLRRLGIPYEKASIYGPADPTVVAKWVDNVAATICREEECRRELSIALQYLIIRKEDYYFITLPEDPRTLNDWLHSFGWTTGHIDPEFDIKIITPKLPVNEGYVLGPTALRSLFRAPLEGPFDFIKDPQLKMDVKKKLEVLENNIEKLYEYASKGLERLLLELGNNIINNIAVKDSRLYFEFREGGISYMVPLAVKTSKSKDTPTNGIALIIDRRKETVEVEGGKVVVGPKEGELRLLAAIHISFLLSNDVKRDLDATRLREIGRQVAESLQLANSLEKAVEDLVESGVIVRAITHRKMRSMSPKDLFNLLSDVVKFLAVLGGKSRPVTLEELVEFLWNLSYITPYGKGGGRGNWCAISFPVIGRYSDIKDPESKNNLERILEDAVDILKAEGLVKEVPLRSGYGYTLLIDKIAMRLVENRIYNPEEKINHADLDNLIKQTFILAPEETGLHEISQSRVSLRLDLLRYLDYGKQNTAKLSSGLDKLSEEKSKLEDKIKSTRSRLAEVNELLRSFNPRINAEDALGSIIFCKGAGRGGRASCKVIDLNVIEEVSRLLDKTLNKFIFDPSIAVELTVKYLKALHKMSLDYIDIINESLDIVKKEVERGYDYIRELREIGEDINRFLIESNLVVEDSNIFREVFEMEISKIEKIFINILSRILYGAGKEVELARTGNKDAVKELARKYAFDRCKSGTFEFAAKLYNPVAHALVEDGRLDKHIQNAIIRASSFMEDIMNQLERLRGALAPLLYSFKNDATYTKIIYDFNKTIRNQYETYLTTNEPLKALANAVTSTIGIITQNIERTLKIIEDKEALAEKNKQLETSLKDLSDRMRRLEKEYRELVSIISDNKEMLERINQSIRELAQLKKEYNRLEGLIQQHLASCRPQQIYLNRIGKLDSCLSSADNLLGEKEGLEKQLDRLSMAHHNITISVGNEVWRQVRRLNRILKAVHAIYLMELQKGHIDNDEPVKLVNTAIETLESIRHGSSLEEIKEMKKKLREAEELFDRARSVRGSRDTELILIILDKIASRRVIRLSELLNLLKEHAAPEENVGVILEKLVGAAQAIGVELAIVLEESPP